MKVTSKLAVAGAAAALAVLPASALAHPGHGHSGHGKANSHAQTTTTSSNSASTHATAEKQCRSERTMMGAATFDKTYGTNKNDRNAFGKCVSQMERQDQSDQASAHSSAEKTCRSEQSSDPSAFDQKYGTTKNGRNAFGKCVSEQEKAMAASMESKQVRAEDNAAKTCRSEQMSDPSGFDQKYGTNKNGRNAFGKCVSQQAKAQEQQSTSSGS